MSVSHRRVTDWHDSHICPYCGKSIPSDVAYHLVEDDDGRDMFVCDECFHDYYGICDECGECFTLDDGEYDDRIFICDECYRENSWGRCEHCGQLFHEEDMTQTEDSECWFCSDCLHNECQQCDDCRRWFEYDEGFQHDGDTSVCDSCYRDSWYRCDDCENLVHMDDVRMRNDTPYCEDCDPGDADDEDDRIHNYGYKPDGIFHRTDADLRTPKKLFLGVENEFSHECWDDFYSNLDAFTSIFGWDEEDFYLKSDSSLERGFEMVSHPRTLASWHELRPRLESFFSAVANFCIEGRDGLHVHMSRRGMTPSHMTRFGVFVAACQDEVAVIARRNSEHWARFPQKPKTGGDCAALCGHNMSRYAAVNWQNHATVELRVFRSTTDIVEFYAAIEFSHAAYQFTKNAVTLQQLLKGMGWLMFLDFVHGYPDRYPALISFWNDHVSANKEVA